MLDILAIVREFYGNQFKCFYLKNQTFCPYIIAFSESTYNFELSEKKCERHSLGISEIFHSKERGYMNP